MSEALERGVEASASPLRAPHLIVFATCAETNALYRHSAPLPSPIPLSALRATLPEKRRRTWRPFRHGHSPGLGRFAQGCVSGPSYATTQATSHHRRSRVIIRRASTKQRAGHSRRPAPDTATGARAAGCGEERGG